MAIENRNGIYYVCLKIKGHRKRWSAGRSKSYAKKLQEKLRTEIREDNDFDKTKKCELTFKDLAMHFLEFHTGIMNPTDKDFQNIRMDRASSLSKNSIDRDYRCLKHLIPFFGSKLAVEITPSMIEKYKNNRKMAKSYRGGKVALATVNLELNCMSAVYTWAVKKEKIMEYNPLSDVKREKPDNIRDRIITEDEFDRLLKVSPDYLKPIIITAWNTAMRKSEILNLTWDKVDLKTGIITLDPEDTKTKERRVIPLNTILKDLFHQLENRRNTENSFVFTYNGKKVRDIYEGFKNSCRRARIEDFTFHDLRHCAVTRWRRQGKDYLSIRKITGHKTMEVFERYNSFDLNDLRKVVEEPKNNSKVSTFLHTTPKTE